MGNSESSSSDPRFISATRAFTQTELEDLRSLHASLATQSQSNGKYISPSVFKMANTEDATSNNMKTMIDPQRETLRVLQGLQTSFEGVKVELQAAAPINEGPRITFKWTKI